jgi:hypothetical protein
MDSQFELRADLTPVSAQHVTTKVKSKTQDSSRALLSYEVTPPRPRGMTEAEKKASPRHVYFSRLLATPLTPTH